MFIKTTNVRLKKLFNGMIPKQKKTIFALLLSVAAGSQSSYATDEVDAESYETVSSLSDTDQNFRKKFKAAPAANAIEGHYIVVFKEEFMDEEAEFMAFESAEVIANSESRRKFRKRAAQRTSDEMEQKYGAKVSRRFHRTVPGFSSEMDATALRALANDPRVDYIEQDQIVYPNQVDLPTQIQNVSSWGLDRIDQADLPLDSTYQYTLDGTGVTAYIMDYAIYAEHTDFGGRVMSGFFRGRRHSRWNISLGMFD